MNQPMAKQILIFLVAAFILSGCDQPQPAIDTSKISKKSAPTTNTPSLPSHSKEVLPGSQARFATPAGEGEIPNTLIHDTPPMDKKAHGQYSYLGAANEFTSICGFEMPEWVQATEGEYYITKHGKNFISQAQIQYVIDPARLDELAGLIVENVAKQRPNLYAITFSMQPIPGKPDAKSAGYEIKTESGRVDAYSMVLFADGNITLSNTRGPKGWDN
jgi:hypothetical protein